MSGLGQQMIVGPQGNQVDPDTLAALTAAGYDALTLNALVQQGATDAQLQNLPYGAGTTADDMGAGVYNLQRILGGAPAPVSTGTIQPLMTGTQFQRLLNLPGGGSAGSVTTATIVPTPTKPPLQWLQDNAWWLVAIGAAVVLVPPILRKV